MGAGNIICHLFLCGFKTGTANDQSTPGDYQQWFEICGFRIGNLCLIHLDRGGNNFVNLENDKRQRLTTSIGSILLILLLISLGCGYLKRQQEKEGKIRREVEGRTEWAISQAQELSAVSPARSLELLQEQLIYVKQLRDQSGDKKRQQFLDQLISKLEKSYQENGKIKQIQEPEVYLDLGLIQSGFSGDMMTGKERLLIFDRKNETLAAVSMNNRSGEIIASGEDLVEAIDIADGDKKAYILLPTKIVAVDYQNKNKEEIIKDEEKKWQKPGKIYFFGNSLYLLDYGTSKIIRYSVGEKNPAGKEWFSNDVNMDLSSATDLVVDGDVWILFNDGKIRRFRQGRQIAFQPSGLIDELKEPVAFTTSGEGEKIWVLAGEGKFLITMDKNSGEYQGQWQWDKIHPSDVTVSESLGKAFLLEKEKIYIINI